MIGSEARGTNPYVGPRPFEPGERLYGREDEIADLYYLWNAERIVLLHSPSGAGKSSLLQAGLLPRIKKSFDVWGPTRVNQAIEGGNRYALSAIQGFEEGVPERLRRPAEVLAEQSLLEYFEKRPRRRSAPKSVALLFDQFEEILTADPLALEAKREFFDQLGELLHNPRIWALFVLREDYLAPLDPYARQVPTHFKNRFRIDLLSLSGAREAIVQPALRGGREFPAAGLLVHDLATRKVQLPDGLFREETGHHVEPVQLQVVCFRLWHAMPEGAAMIGAEDLARFGNVTEALAGYYADCIGRIAAGDTAQERLVRDWFSEELITAGGIRGQVLMGADHSQGLDNTAIAQLLDTHLIRAEKRAGATWFELAHDRLIKPVRDANAAWRAEHLSEVQQRATLWDRQGRPPGLLLADEDLAAAERWAGAFKELTEAETSFLEESKKAQAIADRERRQARRIKRLGLAAMVVGAIALVASVLAVLEMSEAEQQRRRAVAQKEEAESQRKEAEVQRLRAEQEKQAADVAREEAFEQRRIAEGQRLLAQDKEREARKQEAAAIRALDLAEKSRAEADRQRALSEEQRKRAQRLRGAAERSEQEARRLQRISEARALTVRSLELTRRDPELAALLGLQALRLHREFDGDPEDPEVYLALQQSHTALSPQWGVLRRSGAVQAVAIADRGSSVVFGTEAGNVGLARLENLSAARSLGRFGSPTRSVAWSQVGNLVAAGSLGGGLRVWSLEGDSPPLSLVEAGPSMLSLAFRPASQLLAAGDSQAGVTLWDLAASEDGPVAAYAADGAGDAGQTHGLAWSSDGQCLAAAQGTLGVAVWRQPTAQESPELLAHLGDARSVAWASDGQVLAVGRDDGTIVLWQRAAAGDELVVLSGHRARVTAVGFHPRNGALASASSDASLRLWDLRRGDAAQAAVVLGGHGLWIWDFAFSPDGDRLVSGSADRTLRTWLTRTELWADELCRLVSRQLTREEWKQYLGTDLAYEETCHQDEARDEILG